MSESQGIRFYFSFRSPYAWIAAERLERELGTDVSVQLVPMYPTSETFPNDPVRTPNKIRYIARDMQRLAREYGLPLKSPRSIDNDWGKAHAAFCAAQELGAGKAFMLEMFRARFSHGLDVGVDEVISEVAARCGLDPQAVLKGAADPVNLAFVAGTFAIGQERDGIFGVPSFIYRGELFWGHDRMGALRRAIDENTAVAAQ